MSSLLKKFKGLSKGPRRFAAVDCDGRRVRVVYAERSGRAARVLKASAETIPPGMDASDPQQLGVMVGRILRDMRLVGVGLLMTVTRAEAVLKPVTLPPGTPPHEVAGMVPFQVERDLPFRAEEAVIDFTIESHYDSEALAVESPAERGTDVLVGAVRLPVVDHYRRVAEVAGAKLLRLGLRPYANVRCLNACKPNRRGETRLLLHLGPEETEIDLLVGGSLTFSRSAAVKIPSADASAKVQAEAVRAVAMEVRRSVQSYLAVERDLKIDEILIAGGTGVEAEAGGEIAAVLEAPCNRLDVSRVAELTDPDEASAFVSVLGLAIGHGVSGRLPFDFLHPKRPAPPRNRRRTTAIAAGTLVLAAVIGAVAAGAIQVSRARADAETMQAKLQKQKDVAKSLQGIAKQVKELQEWQGEKRDWLAHWARLSALFPGARDAYVTSLKSADIAGETSLSFVIKARDSKIITDLGERLAEAGYKFQPGGLTTTQDRYGYQWSEEIRVFIEPDMEMDLASQELPARPDDDDSVRQLARTVAATETPEPAHADSNSGPPVASASGTSEASQDSSSKSVRGWHGRGKQRDYTLTDGVKQTLRKVLLSKFDGNRDGKLDREEGRSVFRYIRESKYMRYFDANRNDQLDRDEYGAILSFLREMQ